ncbi:MAG: hypothetical protein U5K32_03255 [Bacteroidales bacterium]|nr:hypothetical protein [Bacteroidales bacterium]
MLKKILPWLMLVLLAALLIIGLATRNNINNTLSEMLREQTSAEVISSSGTLIDSLYNYEKNESAYDITFSNSVLRGALPASGWKE